MYNIPLSLSSSVLSHGPASMPWLGSPKPPLVWPVYYTNTQCTSTHKHAHIMNPIHKCLLKCSSYKTWWLFLERVSLSSLEVSCSSLLSELTLTSSSEQENLSSCTCPIRLPIVSLNHTLTQMHRVCIVSYRLWSLRSAQKLSDSHTP